MNTTMADGAEQRLDAQIAEALFGQPGMSKMDVANRVRELRGDGPALLVPREPGQDERARFEAWAHAQSYRGGNIMADRDSVHPDVYADPVAQLTWKSWQAALSAQPSPAGQGDALALSPDENPLDVLARACNVLVAKGHSRLADRLEGARLCVELLVESASAGTEECGDRAVSTGLWFGPQRATRLRQALAPFAGKIDRQADALAARQPVGQITDTEIDARLNALYREMVDSGQHNGGMSGVAWDRAVYRMASNKPSGNSGELAVDAARQPVGTMPEWYELVIRDVCELDPEDPDAADTVCIRLLDLRLIMERHALPAQAVDLGPVREALQAAEGLATICASVDGYSREELAASGRAMRQQVTDARARIDSQAVGK
ncbi:TPA: hypothetical protein UMV35_000930 [Stenotrophomonas maltophilia]|uniref:hypothetical protein n=1 Tax=Stenotrophomonas sp. GD03680 TaxID=2975365 RepID=UPI0018D3B01F|nr:hypothetical protein [Stenotrophomonas sp. GD03680]MBH1591921.1 hypothetical protein [Stenotrophomonas maltophilia]MDH2022547.1 hypothetical protein [Stenotrophomonas sp. GD03680]HEL3748670.1 hypothetical protein [Stenotrophomonas maltophilia]HEL7729580.1 hypothetical protein [Stenotrophomonas maltophilia]